MSEPKKFPCPICGQIIQKQGRAGHNRSKFHLAAVERLKAADNESVESQDQQEPQPEVKQDVLDTEEQPPKPVESITPPEIKSGLGDSAEKSGGFLDWITEEDYDF